MKMHLVLLLKKEMLEQWNHNMVCYTSLLRMIDRQQNTNHTQHWQECEVPGTNTLLVEM